MARKLAVLSHRGLSLTIRPNHHTVGAALSLMSWTLRCDGNHIWPRLGCPKPCGPEALRRGGDEPQSPPARSPRPRAVGDHRRSSDQSMP